MTTFSHSCCRFFDSRKKTTKMYKPVTLAGELGIPLPDLTTASCNRRGKRDLLLCRHQIFLSPVSNHTICRRQYLINPQSKVFLWTLEDDSHPGLLSMSSPVASPEQLGRVSRRGCPQCHGGFLSHLPDRFRTAHVGSQRPAKDGIEFVMSNVEETATLKKFLTSQTGPFRLIS